MLKRRRCCSYTAVHGSYTLRDLLSHCKKNHCVCHQCDSVHKDQDALKQHMVTRHPEQPAQAGPEGAHKGFVCGKCSMYCSTMTTFRVHLATHKKTPCPFCPQKLFDIASRNKHIGVKHSDGMTGNSTADWLRSASRPSTI